MLSIKVARVRIEVVTLNEEGKEESSIIEREAGKGTLEMALSCNWDAIVEGEPDADGTRRFKRAESSFLSLGLKRHYSEEELVEINKFNSSHVASSQELGLAGFTPYTETVR